MKVCPVIRSITFWVALLTTVFGIGDVFAQPRLVTHADSVQAIAEELTHKIPSGIQIHPAKCLTDLMFEAYRIRKERKLDIGTLADGTTNQTQIISPSGRFTIYYDTSGAWACTPEYAQSVARTADSAYEFEINQLGYPKPPYTDSDSTFHLHIINQPAGIYGFTSPTDNGALGLSPSGRQKMRTYFVIDNDFAEAAYPTHGSDAMHVTVFHEFQHVIQYGDYGIDKDAKDKYFQELTSVWMETRSYPNVKDYLQYLNSYFSTINLSFDGSVERGYGEAIWFQWMQVRFGDAINRQIWQQYSNAQPDPVFAMQDILAQHGSSFCTEYMRYGNDLFFTGRRYRGASLFPDARAFPVDLLKVQREDVGVATPIDFGAVVASLNFFYAGFGRDTVAVTVARDTNRSIISDGTITITGPRNYLPAYVHPESFCDTISGYSPTLAEAFPQPFIIRASSNDSLSILASRSGKAPISVELDIYSLNMDAVAHIERRPEPFTGEYYVTWSGRDDLGKLVPSGIYLYTINTDGDRRVGKLAVIHSQ